MGTVKEAQLHLKKVLKFDSNRIIIIRMKIVLVVFYISVLVTGIKGRKFCPRENDGDKCAAKMNTYKCGAFFENLTGNGGIQWLGALPDALKKADPKDYQEILGSDISEDSFRGFDCSSPSAALAANARCYATLKDFTNEPLDSCNKNLVNTKGTETVGDYLCRQVKRWLRKDDDFKANGKRDIKISFQYSQCNKAWAPISSDAGSLYTKEALCCKADGSFERCNGESYVQQCENKED